MPQPLFSILVPTYNQAHYLPQALESLQAQTFSQWEALVVDDGSTDSTRQVMEQYAFRDKRIRGIHKQNGGVASALNEGLRHATGEWVCWLSSDDLFAPEKLAIHVQAFRDQQQSLFFHSDFSLYYEEHGNVCLSSHEYHSLIPEQEGQVVQLLRVNYVNGISIAVHRSLFEAVGYFSEYLRFGQDFDLWLRMAARFPLEFIDKRTCVTRIHSGQTTHTLPAAGEFESAVAALTLLNRCPFASLFPRTDLSERTALLRSVRQVLGILSARDSYLHSCGFGPALLDRLREYVTRITAHDILSAIRPMLKEIVYTDHMPQEITESVSSWLESYQSPFVYHCYDPINEMTNHARRAKIFGKNDVADSIVAYLGKYGTNIRALTMERCSRD